MDLQFDKTVCPCLQKLVSKPQTQELTQELRLPDTMPDIGRILGCWGQPLIRSKEWSSSSMSVTGGVMVWMLYAPEDGTQPQSVDAWMPFQMRWELPQTQRDGFIMVSPYIKAIDCRSLSARKVMLRSGVTVMADALEQKDIEIWNSEAVPEDVQLLKRTYPMNLPQEGGEKPFQLEEELVLPGNLPGIQKLIRCQIVPRVTEQKVMAGKVVFRGSCAGRILYEAGDGSFNAWDFDMPFSQLADLDRDYGPNAAAQIEMIVTGVEPYTDPDGKLTMKCGLAAQYVIFDRCMIEVVEDAYSNLRSVTPKAELLQLPVLLDVKNTDLMLDQSVNGQGVNVIDATAFWDYPMLRQSGNEIQAEVIGQFQTLYRSETGTLQSALSQKQECWCMDSDTDNSVHLRITPEYPKAYFGSNGLEATANIHVEAAVFSEKGIPMVTALELSEIQEPDPTRPSLVLKRFDNTTLWELAKSCGSTVEAICAANQLQQDPVDSRMLLIPIL